MIDLNRTNARAVRDLKHFLEFADRGPQALAEAVKGSMGGYDSPFEEAVARGLMNLGWQVVPQIGVSRFRIDLGIVHPDRPGDYLVGVECDGATYHSAATARDRDKVRAAVLRGLGWKLLRLWSTEWWVDKHGALQRLHTAIEGLLDQSRVQTLRDEEEKSATTSNLASLRTELPASNEHFRKIEEIPLAELRAASLASSGPDLPVEIARLFGILRLAAGGRARLEGMLGTTSDSKDDCPAPDANL